MSRKARVIIDLERTKKLLKGESVTIRIPEGAKTLEIFMQAPKLPRNEFAEALDVFFNGRSAS